MSKKFSYYSSYSTFLLNNFPNAYYAWSIPRRLSSTYTGSLIRIRRSSDNAELDIGYNGSNELDTSAITSFVGANSAYVTTKYDQSGNGRNWVQTTAAKQPRIVNAGTLELENGKPTSVYTGAHQMSVSGLTLFFVPTSSILFYTFKITANTKIIHNGSGTGSGSAWFDYFNNGAMGVPYQNAGILSYLKNGTAITANADSLYDNFINTQALMTIKNIDWFNPGWTGSLYDGYGGGFDFQGNLQEEVCYITQVNSQTGIENNIKTFYAL